MFYCAIVLVEYVCITIGFDVLLDSFIVSVDMQLCLWTDVFAF